MEKNVELLNRKNRLHTILGVSVGALLALVGATGGIAKAGSEAAVAMDESVKPRLMELMCYPQHMTDREWEHVLDTWGGLPPTQFAPTDQRYIVDTIVWTGDGGQGPSGRAQPTRLTYSFPDDGTTWGLSAVSSTGPNILNSSMTTAYGAGNLDFGRELIRQGLAAWRVTGVLHDEVADDNSPMDQSVTRVPTRGDIRIGGLAFGTGSFIAYNAFPSPSGGAGIGGGDMTINTSFFNASGFNSAVNNYRFFRNTIAHEHGHGLGYFHVLPCNGTKLMEPSIDTGFDVLQVDEIRGGIRNYGDRFVGNHSASDAHDFGTLDTPVLRSVIERNLGTNGASGFGNTSTDWFRFTIDQARDVVVTINPTGGTYQNGSQFFGCFNFGSSTVNADIAGNLNLEVRDSTGGSILAASGGAPAGNPESVTLTGLAPGEYTVRVNDGGPNASGNQIVQLYNLTVRVDNAPATPTAIAGINKRVEANTSAFFIGNINSRTNEPGAGFSTASYDWDLTGDGVFETTGQPQPVFMYPSNGVYDVTLRVTDSNGMSSTDTIAVTVTGASTAVDAVMPMMGDQGASVPVTISGVNFKNVADASEVSVSGSGVTVVGAPISDALGLELTGLTFEIDPGAAPGPRDVTVTNADGSATGVGVFIVEEAASCPADLDGDGSVGSSDLGILLGLWGTSNPVADLDESGSVGSADLAILLGNWGPCP
ncbi:MAG: hypothetical protein EA376_11300 [Phycisphaeraceae bacterium]|nr:MAG: hypothetical protein EA376_11300 [Phycisphaeraceae bacterium]